jgi:hypothetical protein
VVYKIDLEKAAFIYDKAEKILSYNTGCLPECVTGAAENVIRVLCEISDRVI